MEETPKQMTAQEAREFYIKTLDEMALVHPEAGDVIPIDVVKVMVNELFNKLQDAYGRLHTAIATIQFVNEKFPDEIKKLVEEYGNKQK